MKVLIVTAALMAVVSGQSYKPSYPPAPYQGYKSIPEYPAPAYKPEYPSPAYKPAYPKPSYDYPPMPYNFAWAVKDDYTYNDFAHEETSDDKGYVTGSYRTLLPDGRTQIVNYKADDYTGFVADVKYEGDAKYPEYKPSYPKPTYPEYKPAYPKPTYPTEPAYPKPTYPAPSYPEPPYPKPTYTPPAYPKASYPEPSYPSYTKPSYPSYPRPAYPKPAYPSYPSPSYPSTPAYKPAYPPAKPSYSAPKYPTKYS